MKLMRRTLLAAAALLAATTTSAWATCSTINPNSPASSSDLNSAPVRQNFAAAYTDVNNILAMFARATAPASPCTGQFWRDTSTVPNQIKQWDGVGWALWGYLNPTTHVFSPALTSGSIVATAPVTASFSLGVATLGLNINSTFAVVANQLAFASIPSGNFLGNATAGSAQPTSTTPTAWFDRWCSATNDTVPYRSGGTWSCLGLLGTAHTWTALQAFGAVTVTSLNGVTYPSSGTSGGVPYFSSATDIASSAALTANGFVLGGGAGVAPTSTARPTAGQIPIGQTAGAPLNAVLSGDVVNTATGLTTIQPNVVGPSKLAQLAAISLLGNCTNATANMAAIAGTANQVARVNGAGSSCGFGSIDLSQAAAVGASILGVANGGTSCSAASGTCLDNVAGFSSTGYISRTGAGTYAFTSISGILDTIGSARGMILARGAATWGTVAIGTANLPLVSNGTDPGYALLTGAGIGNGQVANAHLGNVAAYSLKGNFTGSTGSPQDSTIGALTQKASPGASDLLLLQDQAASGALKYATVASIASAGSVASLNALTGAITINAGTGISVGTSAPNITITNTGVTSATIAAGTGLAVSGTCTITTTGTCTPALASIATGTMLANGTTGTAAPTAIAIPQPKVQYFTASGTFTAPAATLSTTVFEVTTVGAGAAGNTASANNVTGSGGGAGCTARRNYTGLTASTGYTVTIGAGGTGAGGAGGATSFAGPSVTLTANGSPGGITPCTTGTNYDTGGLTYGGFGGNFVSTTGTGWIAGGNGGASSLGGGGKAASCANNCTAADNAAAGTAPGSGGGGGSANTIGTTGPADGAPGWVMVRWWL